MQHEILPMGEYTAETARYLTAKDTSGNLLAKKADYKNAQTETLKFGSKGTAVQRAQERLEVLGYYCGPLGADGVFGTHTRSAVEAFQSNNGLTVDGVIGVNTFAKLHSESAVKANSGDGHSPKLYDYISGDMQKVVANLLSVAEGEIGYTEASNGYTKYGAWYNEQPRSKDDKHNYTTDAWCNMFVSWCAHTAGIVQILIPRYSYTESSKNWFSNKSAFRYKDYYVPGPGDSIYFKLRDDAKRTVTHVGIVEKVVDGYVHTIEGNRTANGKSKVIKDSFALSDTRIVGYGSIYAVRNQLPDYTPPSKHLCRNSMDAQYHELTMDNVKFMCKKCDYSVPRPSRLDKVVLFAKGNAEEKLSYCKIKALEAASIEFMTLKIARALPSITTENNLHSYYNLAEKCLYLADQERTKYKDKYEYINNGTVSEWGVLYNYSTASLYASNPIVNPRVIKSQSEINAVNGNNEAIAKLIMGIALVCLVPYAAPFVGKLASAVSIFEAVYKAENEISTIRKEFISTLAERFFGTAGEIASAVLGGVWDGLNFVSEIRENNGKNIKLGDIWVTIKQETNERFKPANCLITDTVFDKDTGEVKLQKVLHLTPSGDDIYLPIL